MINGRAYAWEDLSAKLPHGDAVHFTDIGFKASRKVNRLGGKGGVPRAYSRGPLDASGNVTMRREEFNKLLATADTDGGYFSMKPTPITLSYANPDQSTTTDTLPDCIFEDLDQSMKEGDSSLDVKVNFQCLGIPKLNGKALMADGTGK